TPAAGSAIAGAVYVAVVADGAVAAIDTRTFDLAWTLVVSEGSETRPPEAAMGLALSPDGRTLYTGDAATGDLVVVDTILREVVARVPLDHGIHAIDLAPDGRSLWVDGALAGYPWLSATTVFDTASLEVIHRLAPALGAAAHLAFTPDGREVWAPSISTNLAWVWDAPTGAVLAAVPLTAAPLAGASPEAEQGLIGFNEIAMAPDGRTAYAVGPEAARVHAIDVARREVIATAQAGTRAHGIAVRPDGREVWTANRGGTVTLLDAETLEELATLDLGDYANHVSFTRDGAHALVSRESDVAVIDVAERTIVRIVAVGRSPHEFAGQPPLATAAAPGR
ncbi:MAG: YncE family protein, partial [Trueperaceae bacterium]